MKCNIFPISNLDTLSIAYKLYAIKGLRTERAEYFSNRSQLQRAVSRRLRAPAVIFERDQVPYLALPADADDPPSTMVVRGQVAFEREAQDLELDVRLRTREDRMIATRFLQFTIQSFLFGRSELWQPSAGRPFFEKDPTEVSDGICRHGGFVARPIVSQGKLGITVDIRSCYVRSDPLPANLSREEFTRLWEGRRFVYHYGPSWYEIEAVHLSDFTVSESIISNPSGTLTLDAYLKGLFPREIAHLDPNAGVILYRNPQGEERAAPAPLCYAVYGTEAPDVSRMHGRSIPSPSHRQEAIVQYANRYLRTIPFNGHELAVDAELSAYPTTVFQMPDFRFGHATTLSVRGTAEARVTDLEKLGADRLQMLRDPSAGFFESDALYRQYCVFPKSAWESYGQRLISDLRRAVRSLFPEGNYDPEVVVYDDTGPRKTVPQGKALIEAFEGLRSGYAVVMIHPVEGRKIREEDPLEALVHHELRKRDVRAAVIHSEVPSASYRAIRTATGVSYEPKNEANRRLNGYLRNVAINKVLLTSQRLPFVLGTRLHADLVIGLDVKYSTAGLVVVDAFGGNFETTIWESTQRERLHEEYVRTSMLDAAHKVMDRLDYLPKRISLHRDGRVFRSELEGARAALETLREEGLVDEDATLTVVEISKSSPAPVRIFEESPSRSIANPVIGTYLITDESDGYICTTGYPLFRQPKGTVRPLHVRLAYGGEPLQDCMEDVFFLSSLTWTRPEGCMRNPVTIQLLDRVLFEQAGEYDEDELAYSEEE